MTLILGGRPAGLTSLHLDDEDTDPRSRLVVVGNGMAGARTVEEILERGGGTRFEITMIGDEPYGNYNRIMLSHVLAGESSIDDDDLMLNPMAWYRENDVKLYAGDRAVALLPAANHGLARRGRLGQQRLGLREPGELRQLRGNGGRGASLLSAQHREFREGELEAPG